MLKWRNLARNAGQVIVTNWPIKVLALLLATVLWAVTAAQEPDSELVEVRLEIQPPEGRALEQALPTVRALFAGSKSELLKLYAQPLLITKTIPDTVSGDQYTLELSTADIKGHEDVKVTPQDVQPRIVPVRLDAVSERTVPVIHRVTIRPDSGYGLASGIGIAPSSLLVRGPEIKVRNLTALYTLPLQVTGGSQTVRRSVPIDTTGVSPVRLSRYEVEVSADVVAISTRLMEAIPVSVRSERPVTWQVLPEAVTVALNGPTARLARLTPDSLSVLAFADPTRREQTVAISVIPPSGITAQADPDSVLIRRR